MTPTVTGTAAPVLADNSSVVLTTQSNASTATAVTTNDTVVTAVSFQPRRISTDVQALVVVTVANPQPVADTHLIELELDGEVVDSREVTVPARGEVTVQFARRITTPGTYTARVDSETATITVVEPGEAPGTLTATEFPGFGPLVALISLLAAGVLFGRRH